MRAEGTRIRYVRSVFVPEDAACFCLFTALTEADAREALRRAALPIEAVRAAVLDERERT
jgi:hypothetical protein